MHKLKKAVLSLVLIAASGAYVWSVAQQPTPDPLGGGLLGDGADALPEPAQPVQSQRADEPPVVPDTVIPRSTPGSAHERNAAIPAERQGTIADAVWRDDGPLFSTIAAGAASAYADGSYTGPAADAYYGLVQIKAIVQGGRLTALKVLQYPSDRRTSVNINRQALPWLRDEAIAAQSAAVDIITGATLASQAFIRSLGGALNQARQ